MATIRLPPELQKNLVVLATSASNLVDELYASLEGLDANESIEGLADRVSGKLALWDREKSKGLVSALVSLSAFNAQRGSSVDETTEDVASALQRAAASSDTKPEGILPKGTEEALKERLTRFLALASLDLVAKTLGVFTDHQRAFVAARVLSDIRPVFSSDVKEAPTAAVLVHSLKIDFRKEGGSGEFFVALDSKDLLTLQKIIGRAIDKDRTLRESLGQKMRFLDPK